jgi:hypothetical protein
LFQQLAVGAVGPNGKLTTPELLILIHKPVVDVEMAKFPAPHSTNILPNKPSITC